MKRCEACGKQLDESRHARQKVVGKVRDLCLECEDKIQDVAQSPVGLA